MLYAKSCTTRQFVTVHLVTMVIHTLDAKLLQIRAILILAGSTLIANWITEIQYATVQKA